MITDKNVLELMKLDLKSEIKMVVNNCLNTYSFSNFPKTDKFELYVIDNYGADRFDKNYRSKKSREISGLSYKYGLSCDNIDEVINVLTQDYNSGIIADIQVKI